MSLNILQRIPLVLRLGSVGRSFHTGENGLMGIFSRKSPAPTQEELDLSEVSDEPTYLEDAQEEAELARRRNKSRLNPHHRNILFEQRPYDQPMEWYHETVRYKKRMLGRYGMNAVDVTPGVAWPTPEQVADAKEYERVAYPRTIQEEWAMIREAKAREEAEIRARDAEVAAKVAKNEKWMKDLHARLEKKERELDEAKERRNKILAEIKRELKVQVVDKADPKIRDLIAEKEKAYKKQMKEQKKKLKEEKQQSHLAKKQSSEDPTDATAKGSEPEEAVTN